MMTSCDEILEWIYRNFGLYFPTGEIWKDFFRSPGESLKKQLEEQ